MKVIFTYLFFLPALFFAQQNRILPHPVVYKSMPGSIEIIGGGLSLDFNEISSTLLQQLKTTSDYYHNLPLIDVKEKPLIIFKKIQNVPLDSYSININGQIIITYSSPKSCYYAFHSLMQLIQKNTEGLFIKNGFVDDYSKFQWRGMHLDVARHFFQIEEIKQFLDVMAVYKFTTFHWHLTDDQGWRIEIKKYPKLTEIGAWRDSTVENHYTTSPRTYKVERYGGFYTQEQIKEIVQYAAQRNITVVPEIEMPGHARAALAAYPNYSCTGIEQEVPGLWGIFDDIFCSKEESILFLQDILSEIIPLFPSKYIHIGGDEAPKTRWKKCDKCQAIMKENHLKDEHELQSYFIQRMDKFLVEKGKKLIGWDEILEGGLSPNAAVMSWRGFEGGIEAAKLGHEVVMSPGSHCYFDHYQGKGNDEPLAIGGFTNLEKVFDFNPVSPKMSREEANYVLGGQANLWTEYIPSFNQLMYMAFPRAIALSEALWCTEKTTYDAFEKTLIDSHFPLLKKKGINFSQTILKPKITFKRTPKGVALKIASNSATEAFTLNQNNEFIGAAEFNIDRVNKTNPIRYQFVSNETGIDRTIVILKNPCLGVPVTYVTKPSDRYNSGDLTLVDGQFGARPWKGHEWIGFDTSVVIIEIDLLKKQKIDSLQISFLNDENSWIHLPYAIEFKNLKTNLGFGIAQSENFVNEKQVLFIGKKVQKFRITIKTLDKIPLGMPGEGTQPWLFIDEISIKNK
ncbi:MAG: family 20 glycosylhydrolase [Flavobacteriia bacterium]|nr:family 20 glycosylhydrolase [Flavobacteriia bacterium]